MFWLLFKKNISSLKKFGPTQNRTEIKRSRVSYTNRYTMGPSYFFVSNYYIRSIRSVLAHLPVFRKGFSVRQSGHQHRCLHQTCADHFIFGLSGSSCACWALSDGFPKERRVAESQVRTLRCIQMRHSGERSLHRQRREKKKARQVFARQQRIIFRPLCSDAQRLEAKKISDVFET